MKKTQIAGGLNGLLAPTTNAATSKPQIPTTEPEQVKGNYKTVCYSIPPEVAEKIKDIAYWDRKKINAVVVEAFTEYAAKWDKANKR